MNKVAVKEEHLTHCISTTVHADDVMLVDASLTPKEVSDVLELMLKSHDMNEGWNWTTIEASIKIVKQRKGS